MNNLKNTFVISQYTTAKNHVGLSGIYDFTNLLVWYGAELVDVKKIENDSFIYKAFNNNSFIYKTCNKLRNPYVCTNGFDAEKHHDKNIILLCYTTAFLYYMQRLFHKSFISNQVAVYFMDGFDTSTLDGFGSDLVENIDHTFTMMEEAVEEIKNHGVTSTHFLPYGVDSLTYAPIQNKKTIDVVSYGRGNKEIQKTIANSYNNEKSNRIYFHTTTTGSMVESQHEHRMMHWKVLLRSNINLCFEDSNIPRFNGRSPILYRWYEAAAAGNIIVGKRPRCEAMSELFFWEGATFDIEENQNVVDFIENILKDKVTLEKLQSLNRYYSLKLHDWRYRILTLLSVMNIPIPSELEKDLNSIDKQSLKLQFSLGVEV